MMSNLLRCVDQMKYNNITCTELLQLFLQQIYSNSGAGNPTIKHILYTRSMQFTHSLPSIPIQPSLMCPIHVIGEIHQFMSVEVYPSWQLLALLVVEVGGWEQHAWLAVDSMRVRSTGARLVAVSVIIAHWQTSSTDKTTMGL